MPTAPSDPSVPNTTSHPPSVNPEWKSALEKAMHLSLMNDQKVDRDEVQTVPPTQAPSASTLLVKTPPPRQPLARPRQQQNVKSSENSEESEDDEESEESEDDEEDDSEEEDREENSDSESLGSQDTDKGRPRQRPRPRPTAPRRPSGAAAPRPPFRFHSPQPPSRKVDDSVRQRLGENEMLQREEKLELLGRLQYYSDEKAFKPFKILTADDSLEDIRYEFFRAQREVNKKRNVKMMQKGLVTVAAGVEMLTNWYNPLNLQIDGFSKSLLLSIREYDEVLEELHWKYCDAMNMPPELKLVVTLGSAMWFYHLSNKSHHHEMPLPDVSGDDGGENGPSQPRMSGPRSRSTGPASSSSSFVFPPSGPGVMGMGSAGMAGGMDPATLLCGLNMVQTLMNNGGMR